MAESDRDQRSEAGVLRATLQVMLQLLARRTVVVEAEGEMGVQEIGHPSSLKAMFGLRNQVAATRRPGS